MATTTLPLPEPARDDAAPTAPGRRLGSRRVRAGAAAPARPRIVPPEERELREELVASALLLLVVFAVLGAVVGGTMGVLWLVG